MSTNSPIATRHIDVRLEAVNVAAYTIPTDCPESDGTLEWDRTTIVIVEVQAGYSENDRRLINHAFKFMRQILERSSVRREEQR